MIIAHAPFGDDVCSYCKLAPPRAVYDGLCENCWIEQSDSPSTPEAFRRGITLPDHRWVEILWGQSDDATIEN